MDIISRITSYIYNKYNNIKSEDVGNSELVYQLVRINHLLMFIHIKG